MINDNGILNHYIESKKLISEARHDGQLVIFVGAGASICSGMPTWGQAVKEIATHLGIYEEPLDFLRIPQYYFNARGKKEYTQLMRKVFRHGDFLVKHEIHDKIIEFNTHTIITTNYDNLIEKAAEDNSEVICVVSKDADLPYRKGGKELIKIHGDFESDNFVLKEDDYLSYSRNFRLIENYVKSIIGTKVVLFLGYSFSDPDIKQIFSWAKDILDGDFQRAYLIESGKEYDTNEADYYKNFGINVLYASVQLKTEFKNTDLTLNLLNMLKWLLHEDKLTKLDELYDDLKPFKYMNFVSDRYIKAAFYKVDLKVNDGYISEFDMGKGLDESGKIIRNLAYEQYTMISLADGNRTANEEEMEKKERINKLLENFKPDEHAKEKIKTILDILAKSGVRYIELHDPLENNSGRHSDCIELANYDMPEWIEAINTFDYQVLENIIAKNNAHLAESRPQLYMEQGYLNYVLKEYLVAYSCFKMAASIFYRHQEYFQYFIAEINRFYIGKMVSDRDGAISGIDFKDAKIVSEEIKAINLDRTYRSLPDFGGNNKALKDIYTFKIAYTLFQDAYLASEKIREQAKTNYIFFSGTAAFVSMRKSMEDYYSYITLNQLAVDQYVENREIFRIYFQSIFGSVMAVDMDSSDYIIKSRSGNVHANKLSRFDLMIALRYEELKNLQRMLQNITINLPMEDDALNYLLTVIIKYKKRPIKSIFLGDNVFWKAVLLLGYCMLNGEVVDKTFERINECIVGSDYRDYKNVLIRFAKNAELQGLITKDNIKYITLFLDKELVYLCENKDESLMHINLVLQSAWLSQKYGYSYDEKDTISKLISNENRVLCAELFPYVGDACKYVISEAYKNWKLKNEKADMDFYCLLVKSEILVPDKNVEQVIFSFYNNQKLKSGSEKVPLFMIPDQKDDSLIFNLVELYLRGLIIDTESLINIVKEQNIESVLWLIDYENYDYTDFDVSWVKLCAPNLLKEISGKHFVRKNIAEKFVAAYNSSRVDQSLLDIYFRYFADTFNSENLGAESV